MNRVEMPGVQTTKRDAGGSRRGSNLVLGLQEVRLVESPVWRANRREHRAEKAGAQATKGKRGEETTGSERGGANPAGRAVA